MLVRVSVCVSVRTLIRPQILLDKMYAHPHIQTFVHSYILTTQTPVPPVAKKVRKKTMATNTFNDRFPGKMARAAFRLWQNVFQTIPNISFFDSPKICRPEF